MPSDSLKLFRPLGKRAAKKRKQSLAALGATADNGLPASTSVQNGFVIRSSIIDVENLHRVLVIPPPGIITVFSTYHGTFLYANDNYKGPVNLRRELNTFDYVLKRYAETGYWVDAWYLLLLQGQIKDVVLENAPFSNKNYAQFVANGSWYGTEPIGKLTPWAYLYPDSWPTPGVFPCGLEESFWLSLSGADMIYNNTVNACIHHETTKIDYDSSNNSLNKTIMVTEQKISTWRPTTTIFPLPVDDGYREVRAITYMDYPFQDGIRYYGTIINYSKEKVLSYKRVDLQDILHDPDDIPSTHSGEVMPSEFRDLILNDQNCSCRPNNFYAFCRKPGDDPIIFSIIDITGTEQLQHLNGPDIEYMNNNEESRKWRISCHWIDTGTGETWSFTAEQFWELLRERVRVVEIQEDLITAPSLITIDNGWHGAIAVLNQWFGRPQHNFQVPHDSWTFHGEDGNIYGWSRYYGAVMIDKTGIHGLDSDQLIVPQDALNMDGIRPTIRYSGKFKQGNDEVERYICVCEKLERLVSTEDNAQGQKEVIGLYYGSPFADDDWVLFGQFEVEKEDETWTLCHVRIISHDITEEGHEVIMMLGIVRRMYIDDDTDEEKVSYHSSYLAYNSSIEENYWVVTGEYNNLNVIDPIYGERWSVDLCVFGDDVLTKKMMKYPSPPFVASQQPYGPYDGYYSGLP